MDDTLAVGVLEVLELLPTGDPHRWRILRFNHHPHHRGEGGGSDESGSSEDDGSGADGMSGLGDATAGGEGVPFETKLQTNPRRQHDYCWNHRLRSSKAEQQMDAKREPCRQNCL